MRSSLSRLLLSVFIFYIFCDGRNIRAQTPLETFTVTQEMSFATHSMNGVDFASPLTSYNGSVYYAYITPDLKGNVVKMDSLGVVTEQTVISSVTFDDHHTELSLAVDSDGYIHLAGNMHGHPMRYWRSANPENISSFNLYGTNSGGIYAHGVTYPRFVKNTNGTLFLSYRNQLVSASVDGRVPGWMAGAIARYDTGSQTWTSLGSQDYSFTNQYGVVITGTTPGKYNEKAVIWENAGISSTDAYQGYKHRIVIDQNNRMHMAWNVGIGKEHITNNFALEGTHLMYAYSDDEGNTWHKANGDVVTMPITSTNADIVYSNATGRLGNFTELTLDHLGNPIILQGDFDLNFAMVFKWDGSIWQKVNYTGSEWQNNLGFPTGFPPMTVTDPFGVITSFNKDSSGIISRSWDGGQTWQQYNLGFSYTDSKLSIDREYLRETGNLRFQNQISPTEVKIMRVDFYFHPIPEPSTYALIALGVGVAGVGLARTCRRKGQAVTGQ